MKVFAYIGISAILSGVAICQSAPPSFESADLRVSTAKGDPSTQGASFHNGVFDARSATVADLIGIAYGVHDYSLVGAPAWIERDRFDLNARTLATTAADTIKLMLGTLLADRFRLAVHTEEKPMELFALTTGKSAPKLTQAAGSGAAGCQLRQFPPSTPGLVTDNLYRCQNMTMAALAASLRGMAGSYLTSPVVDFTGLKGSWNFDVAWTSKGSLQITGGAGITVFEAVDKQLGLKLEEQKRPLPVLVIDHVEQKPAGNRSDLRLNGEE